jgi:hypothetical protein
MQKEKTKMSIELGDKVKDRVSGFQGVVVSKTNYLNGCCRVGVKPQALEKGSTIDEEWFDIGQIDLISPKAVSVVPKKTGGPATNPPRA